MLNRLETQGLTVQFVRDVCVKRRDCTPAQYCDVPGSRYKSSALAVGFASHPRFLTVDIQKHVRMHAHTRTHPLTRTRSFVVY